MASYKLFLIAFLVSLSSSMMINTCSASRRLLQQQPLPQIPNLPIPTMGLPPLTSTLPQPSLPTLPTTPLAMSPFPLPSALPQPNLPTIPTGMPPMPTLPSFPTTIPSLPTNLPSIPSLPTSLPSIPFFSPPPSAATSSP
ncbi:unnamed protein product [Arabidopsis halleri]